jgi:hypothetical protein
MKNKKTSQQILVGGIKDMHPIYASYLMQRLEYDMKELIKQIPAIYEQDAKDTANGKISMFHPNFYVTYVNSLIEIFNDMDRDKTPLVSYEQPKSIVEDTLLNPPVGIYLSTDEEEDDCV